MCCTTNEDVLLWYYDQGAHTRLCFSSIQPILVTDTTPRPVVFHKTCLRSADKWTSVSP